MQSPPPLQAQPLLSTPQQLATSEFMHCFVARQPGVPSPSQRQSKNPPDLSAARARRKGAGLGRADAGVTQTKRGHQYAESHPEPEPEPKLECEENGERFRIMSAAPQSVSEVDTSRPEDAQALQQR